MVLGAVALSVKKGGTLHRHSGLPFGAMFYWLWRVRRRRALPVVVRHESMPNSASEE